MVRTKALVKPELLVWARETAGLATSEAAAALQMDSARLQGWESGEDAPSIPQLRKLGELYKRPLAVFYLQEVPTGFMVLRDLRRLPGLGLRRMPPSVVLEIRRATQRRALALELLEDAGEKPQRFSLEAQTNENPEDVGVRVREALSITIEEQLHWRDPTGRAGYRAWRERMEALGILVFQAIRFDGDEASGFAIAGDPLPVIVINRTDAPKRRVFSLLHEFVHLMLRVSGVSDSFVDDQRPPEDQKIEVFCNAAAAAALIPRAHFLANEIVKRHRGADAWTDLEISDLALDYGVSREALVRRLLTFDKTTDAFYRAKRQQYLDEFRAQRTREQAGPDAAEREIRRNMPQETVSNLGRPLVRMVLQNYYQDRLSLSEVAGYLGVKTKHVSKLEQLARVA